MSQGDAGCRHRSALEPADGEQEEFALELIGERSRNGWPWGWGCCVISAGTLGARVLGLQLSKWRVLVSLDASARHPGVPSVETWPPLNANMSTEVGGRTDPHGSDAQMKLLGSLAMS